MQTPVVDFSPVPNYIAVGTVCRLQRAPLHYNRHPMQTLQCPITLLSVPCADSPTHYSLLSVPCADSPVPHSLPSAPCAHPQCPIPLPSVPCADSQCPVPLPSAPCADPPVPHSIALGTVCRLPSAPFYCPRYRVQTG